MKSKQSKWTFELLKLEAAKYQTRAAFSRESCGAYLSARKQKILDEICSHMPIRVDQSGENGSNSKWSFERLREEATKYTLKQQFQEADSAAYLAATRHARYNEIVAHMPKRKDVTGSNNPRFKWTLSGLKLEALKYKTRGEFQKNSPSAYITSRKFSPETFDQICSHMSCRVDVSNEKNANFRWTLGKIQSEASKYKTRGEFQKNSPSIYQTACRREILDEVCSHMGNSGIASTAEVGILDHIKSIFPKAQTLRHRKIKIEGKPHILGFDIDVYVPELRKGIEFDGEYWHSTDGLRRGRPEWPEEDLSNYHRIKDNWFASKGIQILHVREQDWKLNKNKCIEECLTFLNTPTADNAKG
jgi:hypothetical protein